MSVFYPTALYERITDLTPELLREMGVRGLLLDVDNTLTRFHSTDVSDEVFAWLRRMADEGFSLAIVSNGKAHRIRDFAQKIGLPFTALACKPLPYGYLRAAQWLHLPKEQCLAIGDQVFTDVLGANLAGIRSVQVMPIELETDNAFFMFKRRLERGIVRRYRRKREEKR